MYVVSKTMCWCIVLVDDKHVSNDAVDHWRIYQIVLRVRVRALYSEQFIISNNGSSFILRELGTEQLRLLKTTYFRKITC